MNNPTQWFPLLGTPFAIKRVLLNEEQAKRNHSQTLDELAARGGLSPNEAWANVNHDRNYGGGISQRKVFTDLINAATQQTSEECPFCHKLGKHIANEACPELNNPTGFTLVEKPATVVCGGDGCQGCAACLVDPVATGVPVSVDVSATGVIPSGVYYNREHGNFYNNNRHGMGIEFFNKWVHRRDDFPSEPTLPL